MSTPVSLCGRRLVGLLGELALAVLLLVLLLPAEPSRAAGGDVVWVQHWNAATPGAARVPRIDVATTGDVFVAMTFNDDLRLLCYAPDGALRWTRRYDGPAGGLDRLVDVCADRSGGAVVAVSSEGRGTVTDWIVRDYRGDGRLRWSRRLDGTRHAGDDPSDVVVDVAGNAIVTGTLRNAGSASNWCTVRFGPSGAVLWSKAVRGSADAVTVDPAGVVYATGGEWRDGKAFAKTISYSPGGTLRWTRRLWNRDDTRGADVAANGRRIAVAGSNGSRGIIIRYRPDGSVVAPTLLSPGLSWFERCGIDDRSRVAAGGVSYWSDSEGCDPMVCRTWAPDPFIVVPTGAVDGGMGGFDMTRGGAVALAGHVYRDDTGYDAVTVFVGADGAGWVSEFSDAAAPEVYQTATGVAVTSGAVYVAMDAEHGWGGGITDLVLVKYDR